MPTYEYRCKGCGADLEVVQSFTEDPLTTCEACGGELRKVFGSVGISFKGSGFYKTDSRSGSSTKAAGGPSGDSGGTDSGSSGGSTTDKPSSGDKAPGGAGTNGAASTSSSSGDKAKTAT